VTADSPHGSRLVCPSCHALNPPSALICKSCGIHLVQYRAAAPRLVDAQKERARAQAQQLAGEISASVAAEVEQARRRFRLQVRLLAGVAAVLAVVAVIAALYFGGQVRLRREQLRAEYEAAMACLDHGDYLCARDNLLDVLSEEGSFPDARVKLKQARYGLAQQYARTGQWQAAVDELDALLGDSPGDSLALSLMKDVYDRWLADTLSRGDFLTAIMILIQSRTRFPSEER
jgi:ribosomal protein L40E